MNILLIQPKMNKRPMDTDLKIRMSPSMALLTLMNLTPDAHTVTLLNENMESIDYETPYDLVGITMTLDVMPRACQIAQGFRQRGVPVVAGGIHVTSSPQDCMSHFDALCIGPAERVWSRMLEDASRGALEKVYCDIEGFAGEEIVSPRYDAINPKHYLYSNVVLTSRGCPNRCDFCYNSCEHRLYVQRPIAHVLGDIRALGTRHVLFIDDNFIGVPAYTRALLEEMRGMRLKWSAAVTTKILDEPGLLDLMAATGCQSLFVGIESVNAASLRSVHKDNQADRYDQLVQAIHDRGIMVNASLVFGLDGDDPGVFARTLEWLIKNRVETLTAHILTPYPGTALHRRMAEAGRITDLDLSKYNTAHVVFAPLHMTQAELYAGYLWIYRQFYTFGNIVRRMPKHPAQRASFLLFNLLYRKFGRVTAMIARVVPLSKLGRLAAKLSYKV